MSIEAEVVVEAKKGKAEVVKVAKEVEAEVVKVVEAVKPEVQTLVQEITAEEKLAIREIENTYLKAQMEIQRLSQITQKAQADFTKTVEALTTKYVVEPATWLFDNVALRFTKK
jgi:type IV secretory pathway VirB4 component